MCPSCRFRAGRRRRTSALDVEEGFALGERVAGAVGNQVFRQHDREILLGDGHGAAARAVDHRDRGAPVALAGDAPVAQTELDLFVAEARALRSVAMASKASWIPRPSNLPELTRRPSSVLSPYQSCHASVE